MAEEKWMETKKLEVKKTEEWWNKEDRRRENGGRGDSRREDGRKKDERRSNGEMDETKKGLPARFPESWTATASQLCRAAPNWPGAASQLRRPTGSWAATTSQHGWTATDGGCGTTLQDDTELARRCVTPSQRSGYCVTPSLRKELARCIVTPPLRDGGGRLTAASHLHRHRGTAPRLDGYCDISPPRKERSSTSCRNATYKTGAFRAIVYCSGYVSDLYVNSVSVAYVKYGCMCTCVDVCVCM